MDSKMWICRELMTIIKLSLIASELSETPRTHLLYHSCVYYLQLRQSSAVSCWEPGENSVECCNSPVSTVWCEGDEQRFSASGRGVRALSGNSLNIWLTSNISTGTPAGETWVLKPPPTSTPPSPRIKIAALLYIIGGPAVWSTPLAQWAFSLHGLLQTTQQQCVPEKKINTDMKQDW